MHSKLEPGLGELLRYVAEQVEYGAEQHYQHMGLQYRARYTPVLRAMQAGCQSISQITACTHLTQGAISQTVTHMENEGVIVRERGPDARQTLVRLTAHGQQLVAQLEAHWSATFATIEHLEAEIGYPLRQVLQRTAQALQEQGFAQRLAQTKQSR